MKPLLTCAAVCQLLSVSPPTLSRMVRANKIPYVLIGTGKTKLNVRFREEEIERWLSRRSRGAVSRSQNCDDVATEKSEPVQAVEIASMRLVPQTGRH